MVRVWFGAFLAAALADAHLAAAQTGVPGTGFPLLAVEARHVIAGEGRIAALTRSSMDVTTLVVFDAWTGAALLRRAAQPGDPVAFNGRQVVHAARGAVSLIDVDAREERRLFSTADEETVDAVCTTGTLVEAVVRTPDKVSLFSVNLETGPGLITITSIPNLAMARASDLLCSGDSVLIREAETSRALLGRDSASVESVDLTGRTPLLLTQRYLYAASGSTLQRLTPITGATWEDVYANQGGEIIAIAVDDSSQPTAIVQRVGSDAAEIVSLATDRSVLLRAPSANRSWDDSAAWSLSSEMFVSTGRRDGRSWVFIDQLSRHGSTVLSAGANQPPAGDAGKRALDWLDHQLGAPFPTRQGVGRLIDSYEDDVRAGWTYDAALAAVTFTAWGKIDTARQLLAGLAHLQREDGSWEFAYNPDDGEAVPGPRYIGAMAWVVMAGNFFEWETGDAMFSEMADRGLHFVEQFIDKDPSSPTSGSVSMGPAAPKTISTENTVDAFSAFLWRGRLSGRTADTEIAERIRAFVWEHLGNSQTPLGFTFKVGSTDSSLYLDAQTWTTLAFAVSDSPDPRLTNALATAEEKLRVDAGHLAATDGIIGFKDAENASPVKVWSEGTEGMVAARLSRGEIETAHRYHDQTARMQTPAGGIPYATESPDGWSTKPSVAGTAWFLLNELWPPRNPFNPDPLPWLTEFGAARR